MNHQAAENYLIAHRKKSGLNQREMGKLLGYRDSGQVSRYERSKSIPPLNTAIAYELIFRMPVSQIFVGMRESIEHKVEGRLSQLEAELGNRSATDRDANLVAQKLVWLSERKSR
jgi:transcriptional regulator with XRE-family HTH domain